MITQSTPNISGTFTSIDSVLWSKIGVRSLDLKDWVDTGHFKRGYFDTKCLLTYMSGTRSGDDSFLGDNGDLMQTTWEVQFPIIAGKSSETVATIQNLIGGMADVVKELAQGTMTGVVGCDELESLDHVFELQEPLDDRLMQSWGILTFPNLTVYQSGLNS
jgi:hypothetical protein